MMRDKSGRFARIPLHVRGTWLICGVTLLFLLLFEGALSLLYLVRDRMANGPATPANDSRIHADAHDGAPWVNDYYKEFAEVGANRWVSYVYWRRAPHRGRYINIDVNGLRQTWSDGSRNGPADKPLTVFMFGGSTMWGVGARDDFTIPSLLAGKLKTRHIDSRVVNFGEAGYVTTQEVVALMRELHRGKVPDLVIFYDGVNDIYSAYQQQAAGLPQNESNRQHEFNLSQPPQYRLLRKVFLRRTVDRLAMTRFARNLARRLGMAAPPADATARLKARGDSVTDRQGLLRDVVTVYANNMRVVRALGDSYGFQTLFYWQPTVFDKPRLTPYEQAERNKVLVLEPFHQQVHDLLQQQDRAGVFAGAFHNLSGVFLRASQPVFVDWCHISESGNDTVAEQMATDVAGLPGPDAWGASRNFHFDGR